MKMLMENGAIQYQKRVFAIMEMMHLVKNTRRVLLLVTQSVQSQIE
jgi:hypothetical protein